MQEKSRPQGEDKRKLRRLACCLEVTQEEKSATLGELSDLSLDGAFLTSQTPMPQGTVMPILFKIDAGTELKAEAEVVRVTDQGMGLRFLRMPAKDSRKLRRYIVDLSDAVGAKESAQMLLNADSHITRPIRDPKRIQTLLRQGEGRYYIFPASRSLRIEGRAKHIDSDTLQLTCKAGSKLVAQEPVICLYAHDFASFSFRSTIMSMAESSVTLAMPTEVCYSERRATQRTSNTTGATVNLKIPGNPSTAASFAVFDASPSGFSFKAPAEQALFAVGTTFPEMEMLAEGKETTVYDVTVRHLTTMLEESGEAWLRVGASCNVKRAQHTERSEALGLDEKNTLLSRVKSAGRGLRTKLAYVYHSKKAQQAQDHRGHALVKFHNAKKQEIVGLLDTTFNRADGRVRAPLLLVVPGYGQRKETMSALALTVVEHWRRNRRDIAVLRFDGTNNLGESFKDDGCTDDGKHNLHYTMPGAVDDIEVALRWAKNNRYIDPTSIVVFSISMGSAAARRALTKPEAALVRHWVSFMGAADAANAVMHGSGNIDVIGNYERGVKMGAVAVIGCLCDAEHFCSISSAAKLLTLEHARDDMAKITADVTWFIGKHDAYIDPRRVRDLMSVAASGKREVIEVNAGHVPQHGEEALAEFCLVTKHVWRALYGKDTTAVTPSRGWLAACAKREWDRVRQGMKMDKRSWWRDYLVGGNEIGFDAWSYTPEYQQLIRDQSGIIANHQPSRVLDLGAGTGNMSQALVRAGVPDVVAVDLVPEALARLKTKVEAAGNKLETIATNVDGGPRLAMRRWIEGDLGTLSLLAKRLHPELHEPLAKIGAHYNGELHSLLRGSSLDVRAVASRSGLPETIVPTLADLSRLARMVRGLASNEQAGLMSTEVRDLVNTPAGLPFEDAAFDAVVCSLVLSYMVHPEDTLSEIYRVTKPGGRVAISSMLPGMDSSKAFMNAVQFVETADEKDLPGNFDRETLLLALRDFADRSSKLVHLEEEGSFTFFAARDLARMLQCSGFEEVETHLSCGEPALAVIATGTRLAK